MATIGTEDPTFDPESLVISDDPEHPANLICELCREFYKLGWVTGTGGGISIRKGPHVYLAPSGVQKERILPEHIFVLPFEQSQVPRAGVGREVLRRPGRKSKTLDVGSPKGAIIRPATLPGLSESACTPLFWNAFLMRDAMACIHTHSQHAVMVTLLHPVTSTLLPLPTSTSPSSERSLTQTIRGRHTLITPFPLSHLEMIKGIRLGGTGKTLTYDSTMVIPIIENTNNEEDLMEGMKEAMGVWPEAAGVLVRRHGVYIWGGSWEQAKTQAECMDYLFEMAVKMKLAGLPLVGGDPVPE